MALGERELRLGLCQPFVSRSLNYTFSLRDRMLENMLVALATELSRI